MLDIEENDSKVAEENKVIYTMAKKVEAAVFNVLKENHAACFEKDGVFSVPPRVLDACWTMAMSVDITVLNDADNGDEKLRELTAMLLLTDQLITAAAIRDRYILLLRQWAEAECSYLESKLVDYIKDI